MVINRQTGTIIRETADGTRDPLAVEKDTDEAEWQQALEQFFQEQAARIRARLEKGIPKSRKAHPRFPAKALEDLDNRLSDAFWANEDRELLAVMQPRLVNGAQAGAAGLAATMDALTIGVDWTLVNAEAAKWAREYAGQLIGVNTGGINATTRRRVGERIAEFIETPGMTMGDLFDRLNASDFSFGPVRAQMIAVTEVTRSYWEGNKAGSRWVEDEGYFKWRKTWRTLKDELVCVLCEPLDDKSVDGIDTPFPGGAEDGPPRHVNCRCFVTQSPIIEDG